MTTENDNHAIRCDLAIRNYNDEWDAKTNLIDFLADARHWCDRNDESYAELNRLAYEHYLAELSEAPRGSR